MAAKVTVALLALSCVILVTRYLRAREERESCLLTLDNSLVRMREMKEESAIERINFQSQVKEQESELETVKREKITQESKQRLCVSQSEQKDKHIRLKEDTIEEKEKVILTRDQDLQLLSEKYILLEDDFKKRTSEWKVLKEEFDKLTLQYQKMRNNAETLSKKLLESEKKRIEDSVQKSPQAPNKEQILEAQLKDTDANVEMQDANLEAAMLQEKMIKPQVKDVDTKFNFAPEIKESIVNERMIADTNTGEKKLVKGKELESAASNEEGEALAENMGHALSGVVARDLDGRNVNSGQEKSEMDANEIDNDFHGVNDSIMIG